MSTELLSAIISAVVGLVASAPAWGPKVLEYLRAKRDADGDLAGRALTFAERAREETGRHVHEWVDCERRCAQLESILAHVQLELVQARDRIAKLEHAMNEAGIETDSERPPARKVGAR